MHGTPLTPKKKRFVLFNAIYLLAVTAVFASGGGKMTFVERVQGDEQVYTIILDESNAPSSLGTESFGSGTGSARYVDFDYASAKRAAEVHVILNEDGSIANNDDTQITSMKSLVAVFTGGEATLLTGSSVLTLGASQSLISGSPIIFTDDPYFFLISNTGIGALSLVSLEITYSCTPKPLSAGDKTYFGMYPQTKVTDSTLITTLNSAAGTLPSSGNNQSWTDYGYYSSAAVASFMWHIDVVNGDSQYRGVYFTGYRPYYTHSLSSLGNSFQDNNGYTATIVYWFEYEPISWRVLDVQEGKAFLMADLILDSQDYHHDGVIRTIGEISVYSNNYEYSHIRSWLNDSFYNMAFTSEEKSKIQTTLVDNGVASTGYDENQFAGNTTNDKVFLLSYQEATNASYGLSTDLSRQLISSAYSQAQGNAVASSYGYWFLRSPAVNTRYTIRNIMSNGTFYTEDNRSTYLGIVPALWISL